MAKPLEGLEVIPPVVDHRFAVEAKHLDRGTRARMVVDRKRDLLAKADECARLFVRRMNQHRIFRGEIVQMAARAPGRIGEREQVLLEALIAELTGKEQVRPGISEPEITRLLQRIAIALPDAAFGPVVLDVTVSYVTNLGFAKRALPLLSGDQGFLH